MRDVITVIITCFNLEKYVAEAIESVLNQTYDGPVEILVIDDCSSDKSAEVIRRYEGVRYHRCAENGGVLLATVVGLQLARGDVVFFLDGDDIWCSNKIASCAARFDADKNLGFLTHDLSYIDARGNLLAVTSRSSERLGGLTVDVADRAVRSGVLSHADFVWLGSAMAIRRSVVDAENFCQWALSLPDARNTYQDWPLAFWCVSQPLAATAYVNERLFKYRLHGANHSGDTATLQKAVRNQIRARNTTASMLELTRRFSQSQTVVDATRAKLAYNEYLVQLYAGRTWRACRYFCNSFRFVSSSQRMLWKEVARLLGVATFGAETFTRLARSRASRTQVEADLSAIGTSVAILNPDLRVGGAERVVVNIANSLIARGHRVDLVLVRATGQYLSLLSPQVRIVELGAKRLRGTVWPLASYLRSTRPSAMMANMWPLTVVATAARLLSRVKTRTVVVEHTGWSHALLASESYSKWKVRLSMRWLLPLADHIVTVSEGAADDLARFSRVDRRRIEWIYNPLVGPEDKLLPNVATQLTRWCDGDHKKLISVGALKEVKDYATLLAAVAILRRSLDVRLLILGEGDCRAALEQLSRELALTDSVLMPGAVLRPDAYVRLADLHVLSSRCEGFGNVLVEALAVGTPVVSTDCPFGPREILADGVYGRLVPVGNATALAAGIADALSAPHDRAALVKRAQHFSVEAAVDRYERLLFPGCAERVRNE